MMRTLMVGAALLMLSSTFNGVPEIAAAEQSTPPAASAPHDHDHAATTAAEGKASPMEGMRRQMMAKMNATDAELNQLVTKMNAAAGDAKTAIMADLLTRLVQQHTSMKARMDEMKAQCGMMKESSGDDQKTTR
jgi:hypothetical protein